MRPSLLRVPSGKNSTDAPFASRSRQSPRHLSWLRLSILFSLICPAGTHSSHHDLSLFLESQLFNQDLHVLDLVPVRNMLQPTMGMKKLEVFDTNLKGRSKWKSVKMSCTTPQSVRLEAYHAMRPFKAFEEARPPKSSDGLPRTQPAHQQKEGAPSPQSAHDANIPQTLST